MLSVVMTLRMLPGSAVNSLNVLADFARFFIFLHPLSNRMHSMRILIQTFFIVRYANKIHDFHAWGVAALI